ncbi:type IV secretion system DNA-binding domain-containing protein [Haloferula sp. BvORR071]|uniref:type IV secretory system conjugative DNA transfer family protein n=1 Tax=Haloferula sp. BvORR071 TaxID=1396141 RepID=UPI0005591E35|nr:type IV secretion system DNA-binding domain-containing protein [Haloferula sp. BvORR071]
MVTLDQRLSEQFCAYEMLAGGSLPPQDGFIRPEPPFTPFTGYRLRTSARADRGRRAGLFGSILEGTRRNEPEPAEPDPTFHFREHWIAPLTELRAHLDAKSPIRRESFAQFSAALVGLPSPVAFELVGSSDEIRMQLVADTSDANFVRSMAAAHFKGVFFSAQKESLADEWRTAGDLKSGVIDFSLKSYVHIPLTLGPDPLTGIVAALTELRGNERALVQILFEPSRHPWADSLLQTVRRPNGQPVFKESGDLVQGINRKIAAPLFAVVVRAAAVTDQVARTSEILFRIASSLNASGGKNQLQPRSGPDLEDVLARRTRRFGMLLNGDELSAITNLSSAVSAKLYRPMVRTASVPESLTGGRGVVLGVNEHLGDVRNVIVGDDHRLRHMHVIGASGTGKSTLMTNMILQDMEQGAGLAVIDPHGDLIDAIAESVPPSRLDDVVLLDPSDEDFPIAFNILSAHTELEKGLLSSDLCSVFRSFATSWGDQMTAILSNAILAMLEHPGGNTLADLRRFLVEKPFRKTFLNSVDDTEVVYFWEKQFPLLSGHPEASVVTRLNAFLRPKPIRFMVCQKRGRLDLAKAMDESKILLVRLPIGLMGEENARLFGSLLVAKIHQLVMGRQAQRADHRRPFWLYVDECHYFMTDSIASILSGARKYGLGLVLAHQGMSQIEDSNRGVADAIATNAHIRTCFRLSDRDAKRLSEGFSNFEPSDFVSLPKGRAIGRVGGADQDFNLQVPFRALAVSPGGQIDRIRDRSRQMYGRPKAEVAAELMADSPREEAAESPKREPKSEPPVRSSVPAPPDASPEQKAAAPASPPPAPIATQLPQPSSSPSPVEEVESESLHESLVKLLKLQAQGMNFNVETEHTVTGGRIDLILEKADRKYAIEVSVGNDSRYETKNLTKCLQAGFATVCLVSEDAAKLDTVRARAQKAMTSNDLAKLVFCSPRQALELIVGWAAEAESTTTESMGWKVTTTFEPPPEHVRDRIRKEVDEAVGRAIRRKRGKASDTENE